MKVMIFMGGRTYGVWSDESHWRRPQLEAPPDPTITQNEETTPSAEKSDAGAMITYADVSRASVGVRAVRPIG